MLTTIREKAQGWLAWVIVILISVPFALWGINEYFDAEKKVPVAEINGNELMSHDYQQQLQNQKNAARQRFGGKIDSKLFDSPAFRRQVLNEMITQRLVTFDLQKQNYQIGDQQLAKYLRSTPSFQADGQFSPELYAQAVRSNGLTTSAFENQIRLGNIVNQVREGFSRSVIISDPEVDALLSLQQEKRSFTFVTLVANSFIDKVEISEDEITNHYNSNKKQYMTPEEVRVEYIVLSLTDVAAEVKPEEEALQAYYEENKGLYTQAESRKAQHILLAIAKDASDADIKRIEAQASDLISQVKDGKDFSELAKKYSVDSISAEYGGDLGYFEKGVMDAAFDAEVFSMQKEDISGPIKSRFGIHIIKLNDIKPETGKSFEDVREEIREQYALREASLQYGQMAEEMQNIVYEQSTTLQPAADAVGLKILTTEWFSRTGGKGLTKSRPFIDSAFTEDVLLEGLNSEVVETSLDTLVALRMLEHRDSQQIPLADVTEKIKETLQKRESKDLARKESDTLITSLQSGDTTLKQISEKYAVAVLENKDITRAGKPGLSTALLRKVFSSAVSPAGTDSLAASVQLENGDYVLFSVSDVLKGDPNNAPDEIRTKIRAVIEQRRGADLFSDYERGLYELSDIVIHENKL